MRSKLVEIMRLVSEKSIASRVDNKDRHVVTDIRDNLLMTPLL